MSNEVIILAGTAATIGLIHTILGPDHYLPFIVLSKARQWSMLKTSVITFLCGIGHVLSSIILGFVGVVLGIALFKLEAIESFRGEIAAWLLLVFGFIYFIWGIYRAIRQRPHQHIHIHQEREAHQHTHVHQDSEAHQPNHSLLSEHSHPHDIKTVSLTPWVLFTIFVFGPCEPLIPLIMYPAATSNMFNVAIVASIFGLTTIATMLAIVLASSYGLSKLPLRKLERYSHALAGLAILLSGAAIKFLGL